MCVCAPSLHQLTVAKLSGWKEGKVEEQKKRGRGLRQLSEMKRRDERGEITTAPKPNHQREEKLLCRNSVHIIGRHKDPGGWSNQVKLFEQVKKVWKMQKRNDKITNMCQYLEPVDTVYQLNHRCLKQIKKINKKAQSESRDADNTCQRL